MGFESIETGEEHTYAPAAASSRLRLRKSEGWRYRRADDAAVGKIDAQSPDEFISIPLISTDVKV